MKVKDSFFFSFIIFYAFFFPSFYSLLESESVALINFSLVGFIIFYFIFLRKKIIINRLLLCYSSIFFVHILLSILIGSITGVQVLARDFYELYRPVFYFFTILFFYNMSVEPRLILFYRKIMIYVFLMLVIFSVLQYFFLFPDFLGLYTKAHNLNSGRASAPFMNPYDLAFAVSFFSLYFLICTVYDNYKFIYLFVLSIGVILLTQSRSILIGLFIIITLFAFISVFFSVIIRQRIKKITFFLILSFLLSPLIIFLNISIIEQYFPYLTFQFRLILDGQGIGNSATSRIEQLDYALEMSRNILTIVFGNGPAKNEMEFVESIFVYQYFRYGLLGVLLYFFLPLIVCLYMLINLLKLNFIKKDKGKFTFLLTVTLWFISIPILSIGNNHTEQLRISFFFYGLIGIVMSLFDNRGILSFKISSCNN